MTRFALAALAVLAGILAGAPASHAITFHAGMDRAVTDSVMRTRWVNLARPAYLDSTFDGFTGAKITRISGVEGDEIAGVDGGAEWQRGVRPHYSTDPAFSADGTMCWIAQDCGDPTKMILDASSWDVLYTNKSTMTPYRAQLDSCTELRWHPVQDSLMFGYIRTKGSVSKKLILFSVLTGITHKSWIFQITNHQNTVGNFGWQGDSDFSDNGRFVVLATNFDWQRLNTGDKDIIVFVDTEADSLGAPGDGRIGPAFEIPENSYAVYDASDSSDAWKSKQVGNVKVSAKGNFIVWKYQTEWEFHRAAHRGTGATLDTTSVAMALHPMSRAGLRMDGAKHDTTGWLASIQHSDVGLDAGGREVIVGGLRHDSNTNWNTTTCLTTGHLTGSTASHGTAKSDSGRFVAVDLATGLHRHVSFGRKISGYDEASDKHTSGRATGFRPWMLVQYDNDRTKNPPRQFSGMFVWVYVDSMFGVSHEQRLILAGHHHSSFEYYAAEPHGSPSRDGKRILFGSNWTQDCGAGCGVEGLDDDDGCDNPLHYVSQAYVMDNRTGGKREFWVSGDGDSTSNGFASSSPTRTFSRPLRIAGAHNGSNVVINVLPGATVQDFPAPRYTPTGGKRYFVYGDVEDPSTTKIAGAGLAASTQKLTVPYVSIAGVEILSDLAIEAPAHRDTIRNSIIGGTTTSVLSIDGADYVAIHDNAFNGHRLAIQQKTQAQVGPARAYGITLISNTMPNLKTVGTSPALSIGRPTGDDRKYVDSLVFRNNRLTLKNLGTTGGATLWRMAQVRNSFFRNNHATFDNRSDGLGVAFADHAFRLSDSTFNVTFDADTFLATGTRGPHIFDWGHRGDQNRSVWSVTIDSCLIRASSGTPLAFTDGADRASITYTTAIGRNNVNAMHVPEIRGNFTADHNTLIADKRHDVIARAGVVHFGQRAFTGIAGTDTARFTNNLVASLAPAGSLDFSSDRTHGLYVDLQNLDSLVTPTDQAKARFRSDWNAYAMAPYVTTPGDRAIGYQLSDQSNLGSTPGTSTRWETLLPTKDSLSVYGSAQFDDGGPDSLWANGDSLLNPRPGFYFIGKGKGKSGTDIGAVAVITRPFIVLSRDLVNVNRQALVIDTSFVTLTNIGTATLTITGIAESDDELTVSLPGAQQVTAGQSKNLRFIFNPSSLTGRTIPVTLTSNDPRFPTLTIQFRYIPGGGGGGGPSQDLPLDG